MILANIVIYLAMVLVFWLIGWLATALYPAMAGFAVAIYIILGSLADGIYAFLWLAAGAAFANYALTRSGA